MQPFHTIDVYEMCGEVVLSQGVILSAHCALGFWFPKGFCSTSGKSLNFCSRKRTETEISGFYAWFTFSSVETLKI